VSDVPARAAEYAPPSARPDGEVGSSWAEPDAIRPRRGLSWLTLVTLAIAAGLAAIGVGGLALGSAGGDEDASSSTSEKGLERAVVLLARPDAIRRPLSGSVGRIVLVASPRGEAVLVLDGLGPPPDGMTYQAWVVSPTTGNTVSAALFDASRVVVALQARVLPGAIVGVTVEPRGGSSVPSRTFRLRARA
jgi:hypothetical protein